MPLVQRVLSQICLGLLCLCTAVSGGAESFSAQAVRASTSFLNKQAGILAKTYQSAHFQITVEAPPKRIKVPLCPEEPEVSLITPLAAGRQAVKVTCHERTQQSLIVQAYIRLYLPVLVSKVTIPAGKKASEHNTHWQENDISLLKNGYFTDLKQVEPLVTRQVIKPESILTPDQFLSGQ